MAESLVNTPVYVHHGDIDQAVNVDWSRWGVKLLQRWGYDVRYHEYPGKGHEALAVTNSALSVEWFLKHRRDPNPRKVRIRSAELRNAAAWWARVQQAETPLDFMRVDAEVIDRNVIRLDTDNVLDIVLTPGPALVDPAQPVSVVWNGVARDMRITDGALRLTSPGYKPAPLHKTPKLPGGSSDFFMTPFAVVVGTSSKDPDMVALCKAKAQAFVDAWKDWQKQTPRVFLDTEITDADLKRYSLILIGGADANRVTAKFAAKVPLRIIRRFGAHRRPGIQGARCRRADALSEPGECRALRVDIRGHVARGHVFHRGQIPCGCCNGTTSFSTDTPRHSNKPCRPKTCAWCRERSTTTGASRARCRCQAMPRLARRAINSSGLIQI